MMSQNVLHFTFNSTIPIIPIKKYYRRSLSKSGGYNFLVCTDGSPKSLSGFEFAKNLCRSHKDRIYGVSLVGKALELEKTEIEETIYGTVKDIKDQKIQCEMEYIEGPLEPDIQFLYCFFVMASLASAQALEIKGNTENLCVSKNPASETIF